jgi:hypothetical protein
MKEYKIVIRFDEHTNKIGFLIEKDEDNDLSNHLILMSLLDLLREEQRKKIIKTAQGKVEK